MTPNLIFNNVYSTGSARPGADTPTRRSSGNNSTPRARAPRVHALPAVGETCRVFRNPTGLGAARNGRSA